MPTPEDFSESEPDPALDADLHVLERRLANLRPSALDVAFVERTLTRLSPVADHSRACPPRELPLWRRSAPLVIAAVVVLTGTLLVGELANHAPAPQLGEAGRPTLDRLEALVPVSVESSLREIESNEIVVVEGRGPMQPVLLHFESSECWIDPATQTSVQLIRPWQQLVFYPVSTY